MIEAYKGYWMGYVDFTGRTSVGGYWWAALAHFLVSLLFSFLMGVIGGSGGNQQVIISFMTTFMLLCMPPSVAIAVRRLRDAGRSWTNLFWAFLPIVGTIILIVMLCKPTDSAAPYRAIDQTAVNGVPAYRAYAQQQPAPVVGGQAAQTAYAPGIAGSVLPAQAARFSGTAFRKLPLRSLQPYMGSGVCDVCNKRLSGQNAYVVPTPVFYSSPEWREHFRQICCSTFDAVLTGGDVDRQIETMQGSDSSAGSAVCADCIHMFAE